MSDIKIDLTQTLEFLAQKLGLTVAEIIPYYVKWSVLTGISKIFYGIFMIIFSFCLFRFICNMKIFFSYSNEMAIILLIPGLMIGFSYLFGAIEYLFAPRANAIDQLFKYIKINAQA